MSDGPRSGDRRRSRVSVIIESKVRRRQRRRADSTSSTQPSTKAAISAVSGHTHRRASGMASLLATAWRSFPTGAGAAPPIASSRLLTTSEMSIAEPSTVVARAPEAQGCAGRNRGSSRRSSRSTSVNACPRRRMRASTSARVPVARSEEVIGSILCSAPQRCLGRLNPLPKPALEFGRCRLGGDNSEASGGDRALS